jgi:hypothetical protein
MPCRTRPRDGGDVVDEVLQRCQRLPVGPVQFFEHQHRGTARPEPAQHPQHRLGEHHRRRRHRGQSRSGSAQCGTIVPSAGRYAPRPGSSGRGRSRSAPSNASVSGRSGEARSVGEQRPRRQTCPRPRAATAASLTSRVFPTPASPTTSTHEPAPAAAPSIASARRASSTSLPTTTGQRTPSMLARSRRPDCTRAHRRRPGTCCRRPRRRVVRVLITAAARVRTPPTRRSGGCTPSACASPHPLGGSRSSWRCAVPGRSPRTASRVTGQGRWLSRGAGPAASSFRRRQGGSGTPRSCRRGPGRSSYPARSPPGRWPGSAGRPCSSARCWCR